MEVSGGNAPQSATPRPSTAAPQPPATVPPDAASISPASTVAPQDPGDHEDVVSDATTETPPEVTPPPVIPAPTRLAPTTAPAPVPIPRPRKSFAAKLWASKAPFGALVIVALVDGFTLTASSSRSPLGSISYTSGVLVLSILASITGYTLAASARTVWDIWRFRRYSRENRPGQSLLVFWALTAGIWGCCLILWNEICNLFRRGAGTSRQQIPAHVRGHTKFWSILR